MKNKLVLLSAFLSPYRSGAEAMVEEVSVRLGDEYAITIITARLSRTLKTHDTLGNNVAVIRVGFGFSLDKWLYPFLAPLKAASLRPDIIHAVLETFAGLALFFYRGQAKKILTLQTTNRSFLKGLILRYPDIVTAISKDLVRIAASYGRKDALLIPNGIDLAAIREASSFHSKVPGRILFVGRLEPMKGIDTLLKAFAEALPQLHASAHLRIVGGGSLEAELKQLSHGLGIQQRVTFTGRIVGKAVFDEFAQAEIFCGLSRSEALGNVFLEAQAAGCAVIATNVGGIPDTVRDGETGMLVPPDSVEAAATALMELSTNAAKRASLAARGEKNASSYDWSEIARRYDDVLRS